MSNNHFFQSILNLLKLGKQEGIEFSPTAHRGVTFTNGKPVTETQKAVAEAFDAEVYKMSEISGMSRREFLLSPLAMSAGVFALSTVLGVSLIPNPVEGATVPPPIPGETPEAFMDPRASIPGLGGLGLETLTFGTRLLPIPEVPGLPPGFGGFEGEIPEEDRFDCNDLEGKVALVIGASTGIGKGAAKALKDCGFYVIGTSRDPAGVVDSSQVDEMWKLDLGKPLSLALFIKKAKKKIDTLNLLVLNAAQFWFGRSLTSSVPLQRLLWQVNFWGLVKITQKLEPLFPIGEDDYARIHVTGTWGDHSYLVYNDFPAVPFLGLPASKWWGDADMGMPYMGSKAALGRFGHALFQEQANTKLTPYGGPRPNDRSNICVSIFYPNAVATELMNNAIVAENDPAVLTAQQLMAIGLAATGADPEVIGQAYGQMARLKEPYLTAFLMDQTIIPTGQTDPNALIFGTQLGAYSALVQQLNRFYRFTQT